MHAERSYTYRIVIKDSEACEYIQEKKIHACIFAYIAFKQAAIMQT